MTLHRDAATVEVEIDGLPPGNAGGVILEKASIRVKTVWWGVNGQRADQAEFEVVPFKEADRGDMSNLEGHEIISPTQWQNKKCEIFITDRQSTPVRRRVHSGKIVSYLPQFNQDGISYNFLSRVDSHLYGGPIRHALFHNPEDSPPAGQEILLLSEDLVFNPIIDGLRYPNKWRNVAPDLDKYDKILLYEADLIPDNYFTDTDPEHPLKAEVNYWELADIIGYLCFQYNSAEEHYQNPTEANLNEVKTSGAKPVIANHVVSRGTHLNEALDQLLTPYGYAWFLDHDDETGNGNSRICITRVTGFVAGPTNLVTLKRQSSGEDLNLDSSDVVGMSVQADLSGKSVNAVSAYGDYPMVEFTFNLIPGWDQTYDARSPTTIDRLREDNPDYYDQVGIQRAWRDWVLNEDGSYTDIRPEATAAFDMEAVFTGALGPIPPTFEEKRYTFPRKRRFWPCISRWQDDGPAGSSENGVFIEWRDRTRQSDDWRPLSELHGSQYVQILKTECGIRFPARSHAVEHFYHSGLSSIDLRVTASVAADIQTVAFVSLFGSTPLEDLKELYLDLADRYRWRKLHPASVHFPRVASGELKATEQDDRADLALQANSTLESYVKSRVTGQVELIGLDDPERYVGKMLLAIQPADIGFQTTQPGGSTLPGYPLINGVNYDVQNQKTILHLDTPRLQ